MMALSAAERRVRRVVWLYSKLVHRGSVDFRAYSRHFEAARTSYYRDLDLLKRIGIVVRSERDHGRVLLVSEAL